MKNAFLKSYFLIAVIGLLFSCNHKVATESGSNYFTDTETGIKTGGIKVVTISTSKGNFKVWTKKMGNNPKIKVLLLNGGPGATHEYFECFESFLPKEGIEFIYYDQLGCGNSDNPNDVTLWDLPRYVEELDQLPIDKHN